MIRITGFLTPYRSFTIGVIIVIRVANGQDNDEADDDEAVGMSEIKNAKKY